MQDTNFIKSVLPNGIRVLTEKVPGVRSLSVGIWVGHGSRDEHTNVSGVSHFIEHMIFKGTKKRSALDIAKAFDRMGGISNAFTSKEMICFHAKVMDTHEEDILELLSDIFLNSQFSQEEVDRERLVVLQEISMVEDSPEELVHDLFYQHFWPEHGLGRPVLGTPDTVTSFNGRDLSQYVRENFSPQKVLLACAGNVEHHSFLKKVEDFFGSMDGGGDNRERTRPIAQEGIRIVRKDLEQANCLIGFEGPSYRDERRYEALLFNVILGGSMSSRLFQEIREKRGLAYAVYSFHTGYSDTGLIGMYAGVQPDKVYEVAELMMNELKRLAEHPVDEKELIQAKDHVKGGILLSSESTDARMSRIAKLELLLGRYSTFEEVIQRIDEVTPELIMKLAQDCLSAPKSALILGNVSSKQETQLEGLLVS